MYAYIPRVHDVFCSEGFGRAAYGDVVVMDLLWVLVSPSAYGLIVFL